MFDRITRFVARQAGKPTAFVLAALTVVVWAATGPHYRYSDTWQLVINTGTTIITFLMVFLIQSAQNRDSAAVQAKLNELIRSSNARNELMGLEDQSSEAIELIRNQKGNST